MPFGGLLIGGMAVAGGIAGGFDKEQNTTRQLDPWTQGGIGLGLLHIDRQQRDLENIFRGRQTEIGYSSDQDITSFRDLVNQYLKSGGPSQQDISGAQKFTQDIFAPQSVAMQQAFQQQSQQNNRLATRLGRSADDPILAAKLAQEQTRQLQQFESQKTAFSAQNAQDRMGQQLSLSELLRNQALQNRQMIAGFGQTRASILSSMAGASGTTNQVTPANFGTVLTGMIGGAGAGAMMGQSAGMFGGGAAPAPSYGGGSSWSSNPLGGNNMSYSSGLNAQDFGVQPQVPSSNNFQLGRRY